jgi:hypothetical protein
MALFEKSNRRKNKGEYKMSLMDQYMKHVPEYYHLMYLDGYTPAEIRYALQKMIDKQLAERRQEDQEEEITITTEVRTKK